MYFKLDLFECDKSFNLLISHMNVLYKPMYILTVDVL